MQQKKALVDTTSVYQLLLLALYHSRARSVAGFFFFLWIVYLLEKLALSDSPPKDCCTHVSQIDLYRLSKMRCSTTYTVVVVVVVVAVVVAYRVLRIERVCVCACEDRLNDGGRC
jgi:hypothetical protein